MKPYVEIHTDGACSGNPGPGGWAYIIYYKYNVKEVSGGKEKTTNNQMELTAVVNALKALKVSCEAKVYSDSTYVTNAINKGWLYNWAKTGNLRSRPNCELWGELIELLKKHDVTFVWVKGHNGDMLNERCDELAVAEVKKFQK